MGNFSTSRQIALWALILALAVPTAYANIIYSVNRVIGTGSVTGTIVTDGATGTLAQADILDWNLLLNDGSGTFTLLGPLSGSNSAVLLLGTDVTATLSALLFNFSGPPGALLIQYPGIGSGMDFWCLESANINCTGAGVGETVDVNSPFPGQHVALQGNLVFATTGNGVPEPGTLALLGVALAGLGFARKRSRGLPPTAV